MRLDDAPLIDAATIAARVAALGAEISRDYAGREILLVTVLKGSFLFAADLARALTIPVRMDFIMARSYYGTESGGEVRFPHLPETPLGGAHVLVVEDILDTGRTADAILHRLAAEAPASLRVCTLLDKPARRVVPVAADYTGFAIGNHFVVGYGLDHDERYRELRDIRRLLNE